MTWQVIVSALTGGLAGALLSHFLIVWREAGQRRRLFYIFIARIIAELIDSDDDGVPHYMANRSSVLTKCAEIERDITADRLYGFECARREYCDLEYREHKRDAQAYVSSIVAGTEDASKYPAPKEDARTVKQKMIDALKKLKDCSK